MSPRREISAETVAKEITQGIQQNEFCLSDSIIEGDLDLRHQTIRIPVTLTECIFTGVVDLRYCEFEQCVDFSGSRFTKDFRSNAAVYRKYLRFNEAVFENGAIFDDIQCDGEARFCGAQFGNLDKEVSFLGARLRELVCRGELLLNLERSFHRDLDRNEITDELRRKFESAGIPLPRNVAVLTQEKGTRWLITDENSEQAYTVGEERGKLSVYRHQRTVFKGSVTFNGLECERIGNLSYVLFENPDAIIDFTSAGFTELNCIGAVFRGTPIFNGLNCNERGFFTNARFDNEERNADFAFARFGLLVCDGAAFKGGVDLRGLQCEEIGSFMDALFMNEKCVDFTSARFWELNCTGAIFKGKTIFNSVQCGKNGFFRNARFDNENEEVDFTNALFDCLECNEATFEGGVKFNGINCRRNGMFKKARFKNKEKKIDFGHAKFGDSLAFQNARFFGHADFGYVTVSGRLVFWGARFHNSVSLNGTTIHSFSLIDQRREYCVSSEYSPAFKEKSADLRQFSFDMFEGTKDQYRHVVNAQSLGKFSQDPYLQFERYYRSIGDDDYARQIYFEGRRALRKNARLKRDTYIISAKDRWSWWKALFDWFLCWTVGYGVRTHWLLIWIVPFWFLGLCLFWTDGALSPKANDPNLVQGKQIEATEHPTHRVQFLNHLLSKFRRVSGLKENTSLVSHFFHRAGYSLDLLIPIVNLQIADEYHRPRGWRGGYFVLHIAIGWLLIPLLVASISGVIKKK